MMVLEPEIDPSLCRLCGKADGLKVDIFDEKHNYQKKIHSLLPIAVYEFDPLPKKMCHRCMFQVDGFYEFRENCLKTEQYLKLQLPWMPRKANNGRTDESMNKEPMVHISSPTLNAFTMDQWFVARNMMEADDDVQIVDVFCRSRQSNDRTANSDQREGRPVETDGSRLSIKINENKAGTPDCEQNMPAGSRNNDPLLAVKGRTGSNRKSEMKRSTELSAVEATIMEHTKNNSNDCTMATKTLVQTARTQSVITKVVGETEKYLSINSKKEHQHRQEQHKNVQVYTLHDEQENEVPYVVQHNGKLGNEEDQETCKLVVKNHKEQGRCERSEEQPWENSQQYKLQSSQEQNSSTTQVIKQLECDVQDRTRHTDTLHTTSAAEDTAYLSERGIAHVRKQMKEQQKKSIQVNSRRANASREGCPSGCRRRRPGSRKADMSGCASTKLSKINRKPGGSFLTSQAKDTNYGNNPDEGERRVLAPKNVLKITIPKNILSGGTSDVSKEVHNNICNSQGNLDADNRNIDRSSKEFPSSSDLKGETLEKQTLEERPGIIVTRIPAACDIYTCEACERMFVTRETAYSHMCDEGEESSSCETGTSGEIRFKADGSAQDSEQYSCCVCGQRFSRNATLAAHLKSHTEVWSESDDSDGTGILRDISTDSDDNESRGKGNRRRRRRSRKTSSPRKSIKLSLPVVA